jgi:hypothetical protein
MRDKITYRGARRLAAKGQCKVNGRPRPSLNEIFQKVTKSLKYFSNRG